MDKQSFSLALVTGASSGIGTALCRLLADQGIALIISGRNESKLKELAGELSNKVGVSIVVADVADKQQRKDLISIIRTKQPDLVVNNAGFGLYGAALNYQTQEQMEILEVDGNAVLELTLEAARAMLDANKRGIIMNVSSAAGFQEAFPGLAVYSAVKSFVIHFSQSLNDELKYHNIHVLASCPGVVDTGFRKRASGGVSSTDKNSMTAEYAAQQIWKQIQNKKPVFIFDWKYRLGCFLTRYILPKSMVATILASNINKFSGLRGRY